MTADLNSQLDFLQCMSLMKVAWEKLKVGLKSKMREKRTFRSSFNLIDRLYNLIQNLNIIISLADKSDGVVNHTNILT